MLMSKQELTIEIAQINSIEVDDVNFAEAGEDEVFQQLATDAACADKKNARLCVMRELSEYILTQHHLDLRIENQQSCTYLFEGAGEVHPEGALNGAIPHGGQ